MTDFDANFIREQVTVDEEEIERKLKRWSELIRTAPLQAAAAVMNESKLPVITPAQARENDRASVGFKPQVNRLYIITTTDHWPVKVGVSYSPTIRLRSLQTGHWKTLLLHESFNCKGNSAYAIEGGFHNKFHLHRLQGEWFDLSAEITSRLLAECILDFYKLNGWTNNNIELIECSPFVPSNS